MDKIDLILNVCAMLVLTGLQLAVFDTTGITQALVMVLFSTILFGYGTAWGIYLMYNLKTKTKKR